MHIAHCAYTPAVADLYAYIRNYGYTRWFLSSTSTKIKPFSSNEIISKSDRRIEKKLTERIPLKQNHFEKMRKISKISSKNRKILKSEIKKFRNHFLLKIQDFKIYKNNARRYSEKFNNIKLKTNMIKWYNFKKKKKNQENFGIFYEISTRQF